MTLRLSEQYRAGDDVEVRFDDDGDGMWLAGKVLGFQPPGVWVKLPDGSAWFVTNTRRIRPRNAHDREDD